MTRSYITITRATVELSKARKINSCLYCFTLTTICKMVDTSERRRRTAGAVVTLKIEVYDITRAVHEGDYSHLSVQRNKWLKAMFAFDVQLRDAIFNMWLANGEKHFAVRETTRAPLQFVNSLSKIRTYIDKQDLVKSTNGRRKIGIKSFRICANHIRPTSCPYKHFDLKYFLNNY